MSLFVESKKWRRAIYYPIYFKWKGNFGVGAFEYHILLWPNPYNSFLLIGYPLYFCTYGLRFPREANIPHDEFFQIVSVIGIYKRYCKWIFMGTANLLSPIREAIHEFQNRRGSKTYASRDVLIPFFCTNKVITFPNNF